ncbi:hypothetical protein ABEB36_000807 [Hypothenemus hampei]|uniref:Uncharacterized protein n=1 Tax=Hypothenemus hampei TaxID=57062 RepID=A0ABD1FED7_HYPHA
MLQKPESARAKNCGYSCCCAAARLKWRDLGTKANHLNVPVDAIYLGQCKVHLKGAIGPEIDKNASRYFNNKNKSHSVDQKRVASSSGDCIHSNPANILSVLELIALFRPSYKESK